MVTLFFAGAPRVALAALVKITVTGVVTSATDETGVFGPPNSNLAGEKCTLVFIVDDTKGTKTVVTGDPPYASSIAATAGSNPMTATITIGTGTVYYGVRPTNAPPNSLVSRQSSQTYISTGGESYWVGNAVGEGSMGVTILFNYPPYAANYNWESALNYTTASGNTSGGSFVIAYGYSITGKWLQYADGYFSVTNITVTGLTSPPPPGQGFLGKNNGGNICPKPPSAVGGPKMSKVSLPIDAPKISIPVGQPILGSSLVGDPINAGTGNLFETQTDFTAPINTQLSFTRYYNSYDQSSVGLGVGWHSTYQRGLNATATAVTVTRPDGRQDIYTKKGSSYVPDPDVTNVLTPVPATGTQTGWKLKLADDSTENYSLTGLLTSITTRAGLTTTLTYVGNLLTAVTGPFGHKLAFTYDTSNRVNTMTVPDGGKFTYGYDVPRQSGVGNPSGQYDALVSL